MRRHNVEAGVTDEDHEEIDWTQTNLFNKALFFNLHIYINNYKPHC